MVAASLGFLLAPTTGPENHGMFRISPAKAIGKPPHAVALPRWPRHCPATRDVRLGDGCRHYIWYGGNGLIRVLPTGHVIHETHAPSPARIQVIRRADRFPDRAGPDRRGRTERLRQVESGRGATLGDGRDVLQVAAGHRHGSGDLRRHQQPPGPQPRRSGDDDRQCRPLRAGRRQRPGRAGDFPPHRARRGLGVSYQRPRRACPRRADSVCRCRYRRALAGAGPPGQDRRDHPGQAGTAPPRAGGCRRRRRPSCASP